MKQVSSVFAVVLLFSGSTFAANNNFTGKCAKAAVNAAVQYWADVPNPDPNLEYMAVSAHPSEEKDKAYTVVLAFSDGNETAEGKYEVTFENLNSCSEASVEPGN